MSMPMKPVACISCKAPSLHEVGPIAPSNEFGGRKLDAFLPGGSLWRCDRCHLMFRWPQLPKATLDELYRGSAETMWSYEETHRRDWACARAWLLEEKSDLAVLDVGCFDGGFLKTLPPAWYRAGVEIHQASAQRAAAAGIDIVAENLDALPVMERRFDAVVAFDVIEHVRDPRAFLSMMLARVRPGGVVIIGTGNTDALSWRLMGSNYRYCIFPEHVAFIGVRWCRSVAAELGVSLENVQRFSHDVHWSRTRWVKQGLSNLVYRFAPGLLRRLRQQGWGNLDARDPVLAGYPPVWPSARDHLLALFRSP